MEAEVLLPFLITSIQSIIFFAQLHQMTKISWMKKGYVNVLTYLNDLVHVSQLLYHLCFLEFHSNYLSYSQILHDLLLLSLFWGLFPVANHPTIAVTAVIWS